MKKTITIQINYPDCDTLNISQADLMTIQNDVLNQLGIVEDVAEGRFNIDAKIVESIDEDKLDELASKCTPKTWAENAYDDDFIYGFKAGYRKAMEE